ncbi:SLU7 [Candida pseudojiufengensis]|uniref:SLU7 n=1 Tax=Candida pseudojiufengensis TaxID=497109 RepID=UPI00222505A8|nr:SLU7 [Candida pseudojiufengensis]KAI5961584.1 SLU7 [Candida pseudojiufengensis]
MSESTEKELNPYIPKFIISKPWYSEDKLKKDGDEEKSEDYLSHQRKTLEVIDHSIPKVGDGINDEFEGNVRTNKESDENYDSKRDRWYGYSNEQWLESIKNWNEKNNKTSKLSKHIDNDDSDDSEYELELKELGLEKSDILKNVKEDPMEKMLRDRQDIPAYIHNINSRTSNKIRIEYDPKSRLAKDPTKGILNDKNQFIKKIEGESKNLKILQNFAWELDQKDLEIKKLKQIEELKEREYSYGDEEIKEDKIGSDLNLSLEASPTLMMLKANQEKQKAKEKLIAKRKAILDKYTDSKENDIKRQKKED